MIFQLPSALLAIFTFALERIPHGTPSRWEKIVKFINGYCAEHPDALDTPGLKIGCQGKLVNLQISTSKTHGLKKLQELLNLFSGCVWSQDLSLGNVFHASTGLHSLILVPTEKTCTACNETLTTASRPSMVNIYSHKGPLKASSFHKKCPSPQCGRKFYSSYTLDMNGQKHYKSESIKNQFFITTSQIGFEIDYMASTADMIETAALSFTATCECYETTHDYALEMQRLEEAYFLYRMLEEANEPLTIEQRECSSARIDLEALCKKFLDNLPYINEYQSHQCDTPGCREGFVMADGIEKVHRRTCAAPSSAIKLARSMPRIITTCPETPDLGNLSKFCKDHAYLDKVEDSPPQPKQARIVMTINVEHMKVSTQVLPLTTGIPDNNDIKVHVACKTAKNVDRFSERSAGVMAIVKPCGIIVDYAEMLSCESPSQLFIQLLRLHCDSALNIKFLGYDRGCEFEPFLKNLAKKGNAGADMLLDNIECLVDRFHIKGHTAPKCKFDDPQCRYHPDLARFDTIKEVNTECAEQCFAWLGKFKNTMKYMSHYKFHFFLRRIIQSRNKRVTKRLIKIGKMYE